MWVLDHRNNVERTSSSTKDGHCESPGKAREASVRWSVWPVHPQKPRSLHLLTQCSAMERHAEQQSEEKEDVPRDSPNTRWTPNIPWKYRHVTFVDLMKRHLFERIKLFEITKLMLLWLCYNLLKCNQITYPFTITHWFDWLNEGEKITCTCISFIAALEFWRFAQLGIF